jgi:hypothetical protein
MQKYGIRPLAGKNMLVPVLLTACSIKNMTEKLLTKGFQQKILGLKMGIKGGSAHICLLNDLTDGDLIEAFLG